MVLLAQAINERYVGMIEKSYDGEICVLTGSKIVETRRRRIYPTREYDSKDFTSRIYSWFSYYNDVFRIIKKRRIRPDLVFAISNPPVNSFIAYRLKRKFGCKVIFMDWDIYPEIIERTFTNGLVRIVCRGWHKMNNYIFPKFELVLTIGKYMEKSIKSGMKKKIRLKVVSMFTECNIMRPIPKSENPFCQKHKLTEKKVVIYSGKMGMGHNMDIILDAAKALQSEENIHFLLIGGGQRYSGIENRVKMEGLKNVTVLPFQPDKVFPYSLACGDIGLVTQEKKLADLFLPSKSYDMMAAGIPLIGICTREDDLAHLIESNRVGEIMTNDDAETLVALIKKFVENEELRVTYATQARKCAEEKYDESVIVEEYKKIFQEI